MRPYSQDIRERIIEAYLNGEGSQRVIARRFRVSLSFVRDLLNRFRRTGTLAPTPRRILSTSKLDAESLALLLDLAANNPGLSLSSLCRILLFKRQLSVSRSTVWRAIKRNQQSRHSARKVVDLHNHVARKSGLATVVARERETQRISVRA